MLIEQLDYKHQNYSWSVSPDLWTGSIYFMGLPQQPHDTAPVGQNNSSPFRTRFINELENLNGIQNSKGFPTNVRKIALINGTTNGTKTNLAGEISLELAGFSPSWNKAIYFTNKNLGTQNEMIQTFSGKISIPVKIGQIFGTEIISPVPLIYTAGKSRPNINPRGSMDVVQGGTFTTNKIIKDEFSPQLDEAGVEQQWRIYKPNHTFIPTISSLAFKNPNFDWTLPLNRNLLCNPNNKEIEFDSYFSPAKNEEHVALTNESVEWLLKEINGSPQAPWFYVNSDELVGEKVICQNEIVNYNFGTDVCKLPSLVKNWEVNENLQILSSSSLGLTVKAINNGAGIITAVFDNEMKVTKKIWVEKPNFALVVNVTPDMLEKSFATFTSTSDDLKIENQGITAATLTKTSNNGISTNIFNNGFFSFSAKFNGYNTNKLTATATNRCGTTTYTEFFLEMMKMQNPAQPKFFSIYPNPSHSIINIELKNQNHFQQYQ